MLTWISHLSVCATTTTDDGSCFGSNRWTDEKVHQLRSATEKYCRVVVLTVTLSLFTHPWNKRLSTEGRPKETVPPFLIYSSRGYHILTLKTRVFFCFVFCFFVFFTIYSLLLAGLDLLLNGVEKHFFEEENIKGMESHQRKCCWASRHLLLSRTSRYVVSRSTLNFAASNLALTRWSFRYDRRRWETSTRRAITKSKSLKKKKKTK